MKIIHEPHEIYAQLDLVRREGNKIGLVLTMGALHAGHLSLVAESKKRCDTSVATIFVNPTQFAPHEDLAKYPRTLESDIAQLRSIGCDYLFVPSSDRIYGEGHSTFVEPPSVGQRWEGAIRPGHFRGVATIVLKLFHMIPSHVAFFGRKDYQQVAVLRAMVDDLNVPIRIETCDTIREADGLAMSSRNRYLDDDQRRQSVGLWSALQRALQWYEQGERRARFLESQMKQTLEEHGIHAIDYAAVVDARTMEPIEHIEQESVAIIAARVGSTRLIDNLLLERRD